MANPVETIPVFAARIKSKYPEYKDIDDTVLTQKILSKYPEYADQVDMSGVSGGVKKKDIGSLIGGTVGGLTSGSASAAGSNNQNETNEPLGFGAKAKQSVMSGIMHPDVSIDHNDPAKSVLQSYDKDIENVKSTLENTYYRDGVAIKDNKIIQPQDIQTAHKAISDLSKEKSNTEQNFITTDKSARQWLFQSGKIIDPLNKTDQLALQTHLKRKALDMANEQSGNFEDVAGAINGVDIKNMPEATKGRIVKNALNDPLVIEKRNEDGDFHNKYIDAQYHLYDNYPAFAFKDVGEMIGQKLEDKRMTGWLYANPSLKKVEKAIDMLKEDGVWGDQQQQVFNEKFLPYIAGGAADKVIPLTDLAHQIGYGAYEGAKSFDASGRDIINKISGGFFDPNGNGLFQNLGLMENNQDRTKRLAEEEASTARVEPTRAITKVIDPLGNFTGQMTPLILGEMAGIPTKLNMGLMFEGRNADDARAISKDVGVQNLYTLLTTTADIAGSELLPTKKAATGFKNLMKNDVKDIITDLTDKKITEQVAEKTYLDKATEFLGKIAKTNTTTANFLTAYNIFHKGAKAAFGGQSISAKNILDEALNDYPANWLSGTFLSGIGATHGEEQPINGQMYKKISDNADYFRDVINNDKNLSPTEKQDRLEKIDRLQAVGMQLSAKKLDIGEQEKYLNKDMQQFVAQKAIGESADNLLAKDDVKKIAIAEIEKEHILNPMSNTTLVEKLYNHLPKGSQQKLSTDGDFDKSKVTPYLEYIAQQSNGLDENWKPQEDGRIPRMADIPDSIKETANKKFEKQIESAQQEETTPEPDNQKTGTPEENLQTTEQGAAVVTPEEVKQGQKEIVPLKKVEPNDQEINPEGNTENQQGEQPPTEEIKPSEPPIESGTPTESGQEGTGITHAQTAETRKEFGLPEYEKEADTFAKWDAEAKQRVESGEMPKVIEKLKKDEMPTPVEQRMMGLYIAELAAKAEREPSNENLDALHSAIKLSDKIGGSLVGKTLVSRKGTFLPDESLAGYFEAERMANNDAPLTENQKSTATKEYENISDLQKKYDEKVAGLEAENAKLKAESEIKKTPRKKNQKKDYAAERKQIFESIKEKLAQARQDTNVTILPYAKELIAIAPDVAKLVKNLVEDGITKLGDIVDNLHENLKDVIPGIQKKDIHDIIAGEYNEKKQTRNEIAKQLFDLRQQAKLMNKLDNLLKGEEPKSEKRKIQRNREIENLRKQIKDVEGFDKEVLKIKEEQAAQKAKQKLEIETELKKAEKESDTKEEKETRAKELEMKMIEKEAKYRSPEEIALDNAKSKMKSQIEELEKDLPAAINPPPKEKIKLDAEGKELQSKLIRAKRDREIRLLKQEYQNRTKWQRARDWTIDKLNIPRTIMASMDYSAPLRQGIVAAVAHPRIAGVAQLAAFKASFSPKYFDRWFYDIKKTPRYDTAQQSELSLTDPHSPFLTAKEEAFMNNTAEKIPLIGKLIQGSERAYVMFLNKMRWDLFNRFADRLEEQGKTFDNSPKEYKALAHYVNNQTGRGGLGKLENYAPILNTMFFAPRLIAARLNLLNPLYYAKLPKDLRVMAAKDMLKFVGLGMTVLALAKLNGAQVDDDPRSSDFGKIKQGNTRWDIWGGFQQYIRMITQFSLGERKSTATGQIQELNGKGAFGTDRTDVLKSFVRGKLAPVPSMAVDFLSGRNATGQKVTLSNEAQSHLLPLLYGDIQQAVQDRGVKAIFDVGVPAVFGVGVQTYQSKQKSKPTHLVQK